MAQPWKEVRFESLSIDEGLSQSTVNCILQDQTGFLWLGTQSGLNRYDGYQFKVYNQESGDLNHNWITSLAEDSQGLWVGTEGGGVTHFNRSELTRRHLRHNLDDPGSLSSDRIRFLLSSRHGDLWIGTVESGLNRLRPGARNVERLVNDPDDPTSLPDDRVRALVEDDQGRLWVGTLGGLSLLDPDTEAFESVELTGASSPSSSPTGASSGEAPAAGPQSPEILALHLDSSRRLWIGTRRGLLRLDIHSGKWVDFSRTSIAGDLSHEWVRAIFQDRNQRVWVGTEGGLNLWQDSEQSFATFRADPSNPNGAGSDQIFAITEDRSGNIWLGTFQEGAKKWNPSSLYFQHLKSSLPGESSQQDNIFAISVDAEGDLWTGSFGGGILRTDRKTLESQRYVKDANDPSSLSDNRVTALLHDSSRRLWAGTVDGGLLRLVAGSESFEHFRHDPADPLSLSADAVTVLYQDSLGEIWVGTYGSGLNRFVDDAHFERFRAEESALNSLSNDRVFAIAERMEGSLWLATDGGGLNLMKTETGSFRAWRHDSDDARSLSSDELLSLHVDQDGRLWIGTKAHGLDLMSESNQASSDDLEGVVFQNYSLKDGFPDTTIWGIQSDSHGHLWLGTNSGLVRFDPTRLKVRKYDTSHGLQSMEFNQGAHFRSSEGELFFGGVQGVNAFFPERVRGNTTPPNVALTRITLLNKSIAFPVPLAALDTLELAYDDHFLALEFAALDFTAPEKNQYRYQLEGLEDRWVDIGPDRKITFTSLQPGNYKLRVQGSNNDGVWSDEERVVRIRVTPPLWANWWAYTFYGILGVALVFGFLRRRERRALEEKKRLEDLVAVRTQELRTRASELEMANHELAEENLRRRELESERIELLEQIEAIGRYRMEAKLGAGGMGEVYRAFDTYLSRYVAMKFIHPEYLGTEIAWERFRREARLVASVQHEAVVQVYDVLRWSDRECIVMELIDGWTMSSILKKGPLEPSWALRWLIEITSGLAAAHSKEVVHRDLKAGNIMVTRSGRAKILDFGLAKRLTQTEISLSRSGQILGTLGSMSPEQAMGESVDLRADLFSLGALAYRMLTGKEPFLGDNPLHTLRLITAHQPEPVRKVEAGAPKQLSDLIDRLLEKSPAARPKDAMEVLASLEEIDPRGLHESSVARIREIFRLKWVKGLGNAEVSSAVQTPESLVALLGSRARSAGIRSWSELENLDETTFEDLLTNPLRDQSG